jgi:sugar phosphate permease
LGLPRTRRFETWRLVTTACLFTGYLGYYLCRANLDAVLPLIARDLELDPLDLGVVATVSVWFYAAGKFLLGFLADVLGGRWLFFGGLVGAVLFTALFGMAETLPLLLGFWSANRFLQAAGWGGMVQITAQWYPKRRVGSAMAVLSLSYMAGDVAARALSGGLIDAGLGWRSSFLVPSGILAAIGAIIYFLVMASPSAIQEPPLEESEAGPPPAKWAFLAGMRGLLSNGPFWMLALMSITLTGLRLALLTWTSSYLLHLGLGDGPALVKSAVLPAAGIAGTLFAGLLSDYRSHGRRGPVSLGLLVLLVAALGLLASPLGQEPGSALTLIAVAGFALYGPYSLIAGAGAIDFGGRQAAAAAAGLLDGLGYVFGAVMGGVGMAGMTQSLGWEGAFLVLASLAGLTMIPAALLTRWQKQPAVT